MRKALALDNADWDVWASMIEISPGKSRPRRNAMCESFLRASEERPVQRIKLNQKPFAEAHTRGFSKKGIDGGAKAAHTLTRPSSFSHKPKTYKNCRKRLRPPTLARTFREAHFDTINKSERGILQKASRPRLRKNPRCRMKMTCFSSSFHRSCQCTFDQIALFAQTDRGYWIGWDESRMRCVSMKLFPKASDARHTIRRNAINFNKICGLRFFTHHPSEKGSRAGEVRVTTLCTLKSDRNNNNRKTWKRPFRSDGPGNN